ncbi:Quinonprotein alcohol dehydrogenase-like protein [Leishmania donovani]|uniref:Quinonprotein_alcohol_dehydrogenase-like_protein_ putative/GeneDB:LmjF.20.0620 n=1 Tax=Leishmania donovani TaxID=5661 RepID=A0A6J8FDJ9_LEIDO|nr:Quinonprotein alcohol dehydrogenase-like protein [Leishmania donovani]VDZ44241.1 Quinonprotein_alcohol_dehydrogenase-like_protein_putative/GeneDB:LmjF.20.0620 [Leishmania donovani]
MVSYDVDGDGLEEVIVGTTEGLLCVVKPDHREPLFLRVLAATISVVLYTPIQSRLVLVTLEGQCEVIDHFLKPTQKQQAGSEPANMNATSPTEGGDGGAASVGGPRYQRTDSTSSLPRTSPPLNGGGRTAGGARAVGGGATASPHSAGRPWGAESAMPTRVFHVPSNCLCADLSPDRDSDLVFLGSYDRRFYVYSIINGSCLLSLFVHDPITSVKAFAIPTCAADTHPATTLSPISVCGKRVSNRGSRCGSTTGSQRTRASSSTGTGASILVDSPREMETTSDRPAKASALSYIPLVFISTPTHLILLPAGLGDIQQWRKLQPKSAHLPLTVQLRSDDPPLTPHPPQHSKQQQAQRKHTGRRSSLNGGGGAANMSAALATSATVHLRSDDSHPREGESAVPPHMTRVPPASLPSLRQPLSMSADAGLRGVLAGSAPGGKASSRPGRLGGAATERRCDSVAVMTGGAHHTSAVSVPAAMTAAAVAAGASAGLPLSSSQLRRQARRHAIQAAEMGRPVLVKPLWALHIGRHALDVPLLQPMVSPDGHVGSRFASAAAAAGSPQPSSVTGAIEQEAAPGTAAGNPSALQPYGGGRSSIMSIQGSVGGTTTSQRAANSSVFYVSLPSSTSALQESTAASSNTCNSVVRRRGTVAGSADLWHRRVNGHSCEGGEDTEASNATPTLSSIGVAAAQNTRRSSLRTPARSLPRQLRQCSANDSSDGDGPAVGGRRCSSGDDDEDAGLLSDDGALSYVGGAAPVMSAGGMADRAHKEDDNSDGDYGTATDEDFGLDRSGASTTRSCCSSSGASDRSSSIEVNEGIEIGGRRALTSNSMRHSRHHHHHGTDTAEPALLARSLSHRRAESAPTILLRRTRIADGADNENSNAGAVGLLETPTPTKAAAHVSLVGLVEQKSERRARQRHRWAASRGQGERGGRGPSRERHAQVSVSRQQYAQQHTSAHSASPPLAAVASAPVGAGVRLPTSVDVSVGASQVAVALSCEDGLALELRFSIVRLSSLSRCERRLPRGTVRLYDMQNPRGRHATAGAARRKGGGATKGSRPRGEVPGRDDGGGSSMRPASPSTSPEDARLRQPHRSRGSQRQQPQRKGASPVTYNIYLPAPAAGQVGTAAALSSLSHISGLSFTSSHQRQCSRSGRRGCGDAGGALATTTVISTPAVTNVAGAAGVSLAQDDTACPASATANHPLGVSAGDASMLDADGGAGRNSRDAYVQHYREDALVLQAQCLWAARLSDSPLVQRSRVFSVRDHHLDNAFCTVFVAANGTCFAVDGDTLSVVECCIKEDCSSFTLMVGPLSTTPMLPARASATTLQEATADASAWVKDGVANGVSAATMSFNVLRGAVGRTISCVCVGLDELCVYSVGEANQLWGRRDCSTGESVTSGANEQISLLSRCLPDKSCASVAEAAGALTGEAGQGMDAPAGCSLASMDSGEQALLRQLAVRLRQHEQYASPPSHHDRGTGAGAASGGEHAIETDEEALMRVKKLLLYDYSEQEWERLQWLDHALT